MPDGYLRAGSLNPEYFQDEHSYGMLVVDVLTCEACGALVSEEAVDRHDGWHQREGTD